jgi:hypothetical protein
MGGLLAARVLADFYETVTVVERDKLTDAADHRRGVPQGRHFHALWSRGAQELERLFSAYTPNSSPPARRYAMTATSRGCRYGCPGMNCTGRENSATPRRW